MIISALIEARGCERFFILAKKLNDPELKSFYSTIAESEAAHYMIFLRLAKLYFNHEVVESNLAQWADFESKVMLEMPITHRLH